MMAWGNGIRNYNVDDALEQINQSEYGAHHLIVYPELRVLRELYTKYIRRQLEHENKVVLLLPHYESADKIRKVLSDRFLATEKTAADNDDNTSIDVKKYEDEGSFIVMDSLKARFGINNHMAFLKQLLRKAEDSSKNGVSIIADCGSFLHLNNTDKLIEHELSMPSQLDINLKRFCVFHKQDFNRLTEDQRQKLVNHHGQVLVVEDE